MAHRINVNTHLSSVIAAADHAYATAAAVELGYPSAAEWLAAQDTPEFKRRVLARTYRRNVELALRYGSRAVATLLDNPEPLGPDDCEDREQLDEYGRWFTCPQHGGAVTQDCHCSATWYPVLRGSMPRVSYTHQWAAVES